MCLEKYLLSMYRKTFAKRLESLSMKDERTKTNSTANEKKFAEVKEQNDKLKENPMTDITSPVLPSLSNPLKECDDDTQRLVDSTILRCHSSLSHAACSFRASSPLVAALPDAVDSYHSMPLSMLEVRNHILGANFVTLIIYWEQEREAWVAYKRSATLLHLMR